MSLQSERSFSILRVLGGVFVFLLICLIIFIAYLFIGKAPRPAQASFGVTFSQTFAEKLDSDWKKMYLAILDDLGVRKLRLVAYWPEIEGTPGKYIFDDLDWQINEAERRGAEIILTVGQKLPRWPECHIPDWARTISQTDQQTAILKYIYQTVERYKGNKAIKYWQVENEPFLIGFGGCLKLDKDFLDREIALVEKLDKKKPVILTTSGELSLWTGPAIRTDILGTTLYRVVWNIYLGHFHYPIPPVFYYKRANLVKKFFGVKKVFVAELQAEPWNFRQIYELPAYKQLETMNPEEFAKTIEYFKQTGLEEAYLWGAEWWYWLKTSEGDERMWLEAKKLF